MIYFIEHTNYVKIGYTNDIHKRLSQLQVSCPIQLTVLGLIDGDLNEEKKYHEKFKQYSVNGEWFNYSEEIRKHVESLDDSLLWKFCFINHEKKPMGIIKQCRILESLSMEDLGERMGITKQSVKDMELRDLHSRITVSKIIQALSVMGYKYEFRAIKK